MPDAVIEREPPISLDEWLAFIRSIGGGPYRVPYRERVTIGATLRSPASRERYNPFRRKTEMWQPQPGHVEVVINETVVGQIEPSVSADGELDVYVGDNFAVVEPIVSGIARALNARLVWLPDA